MLTLLLTEVESNFQTRPFQSWFTRAILWKWYGHRSAGSRNLIQLFQHASIPLSWGNFFQLACGSHWSQSPKIFYFCLLDHYGSEAALHGQPHWDVSLGPHGCGHHCTGPGSQVSLYLHMSPLATGPHLSDNLPFPYCVPSTKTQNIIILIPSWELQRLGL